MYWGASNFSPESLRLQSSTIASSSISVLCHSDNVVRGLKADTFVKSPDRVVVKRHSSQRPRASSLEFRTPATSHSNAESLPSYTLDLSPVSGV